MSNPLLRQEDIHDDWIRFKRDLCEELGKCFDNYTDDEARCDIDLIVESELSQFPLNIAMEAQRGTVAHFIRKLPKYRSGSTARAWLKEMTRNLARDLIRKTRRQRTNYEEALVSTISDPDTEHEDSIVDCLITNIQEAVQIVRERKCYLKLMPNGSVKLDYYLILMIEYRIRITSHLQNHKGDPFDFAWVNRIIPWELCELVREVRKGWPNLKRIWSVVCDGTFFSSEEVRQTAFDDLNQQLSDKSEHANLSKWNSWVKRAKKAFRSGKKDETPPISEENWKRYFEGLFPDYQIDDHAGHQDDTEEGSCGAS